MGLITKKIRVMGDKGEEIVNCLFDTGAAVSFIRRDIVQKIATPLSMPKSMRFKLGDGNGEIEAKEATHLSFELEEGCEIFDDVVIVEELAEDLIIGAGTLQKWRIKLDLERDDIIIDKKALELKLV